MIDSIVITSIYLGSAVVSLAALGGVAYLLSQLFGFR